MLNLAESFYILVYVPRLGILVKGGIVPIYEPFNSPQSAHMHKVMGELLSLNKIAD